MSADKYSAEKLSEFWAYVIDKGLMNKETATSRKIAAQKVLSELDESDRQDLRSLDRDQAFLRFQNIAGKNYTPSSLTVYRSRFNTSLDNFFSYIEDPSGFKPNFSKGNGKTKGEQVKPKIKNAAKSGEIKAPIEFSHEHQATADNLTLPIPLRPGVVVKIFGLPSDLTEDEAKKISGVVNAYAYAVKGS